MHDEKWQFKKFGAMFRAKIENDDDLVDLTYLGEYVAKLNGEDFYVDRRKGILYGETTVERRGIKNLVKDGSGALLEPIGPVYERLLSHWVSKVFPVERKVKIEANGSIEELDFNASLELQQWFDDWNWLRVHEDEIIDWNHEEGWVDVEYRVILANNLSTDRDNWSYGFWIPGENHLPHNIKNWRPYQSEHIKFEGVPLKTVNRLFEEAAAKFKYHGIQVDLSLGEKEFWLDVFYACEDYERMEDYGKTWSSVGVVVELVIDHEVVDEASCWGIESDSDDSYFDEMANTLVHDIAIRTHDRLAHTRKVSSHLSRIGRNYKAWEKRRKEKDGAK